MQKFTRFANTLPLLHRVSFLLLSFFSVFFFAGLQVWGQTPGQRSAILDQYGKLPLAFEANHGQTDPSVTYLSRSDGYTLWLTPSEAVFGFSQPDKKTASFRLSLVGAN